MSTTHGARWPNEGAGRGKTRVGRKEARKSPGCSEPAPKIASSEDSPCSAAESLFVTWLACRAGGEEKDFALLCREHPERETELREAHSQWRLLARILRGSGVKEAADPEREREAKEGIFSQVLPRFARRGPASTRYRPEKEIARGGMGAVLGVWDKDLERQLAMKVMRSKCPSENAGDRPSADLRKLARFMKEARITAQLEHPGIVPVHDLGVDSAGRAYFTMPLVQGCSLGTIFDLVRDEKEGWNRTRALGPFLKVCEAVAYAHSKGVIHRDIKPGNVMVGRFGEVYVMDWGLAKVIGGPESRDLNHGLHEDDTTAIWYAEETEQDDISVATTHGVIIGTPLYMPPEQARGEIDKLDRRSDIYSLGALLYHLLTGGPSYLRPGCKDSLACVLDMVIAGPPTPVHKMAPDVPLELEAICEKAMARDPDDRYADVPELIEDVQQYLADRPVTVYRKRVVGRVLRWRRHHRTLVGTALVAAIALLLFGANLLRLTLHERQERLADALIHEIGLATEALQALQSHYAAVGSVSRADFRSFVEPYLERGRGLRALEWIPVVAAEDRSVFEEEAREAGFEHFSFTELTSDGLLAPVSARECYHPVYFLEPWQDNEEALGFDLKSSVTRDEAMKAAWDSDMAIATEPIELVQEGSKGPGILIFRSVPGKGRSEGEPSCEGYVCGVYCIEQLIANAWQNTSAEHLRISLYDVTDTSNPYRLWTNAGDDTPLGFVDEVDAGPGPGLWPMHKELEVCKRKWKLVTRAKPSFLFSHP